MALEAALGDTQLPSVHPLRIGTSGFVYRHWRGVFYPAEMSPDLWLEHYARTFDTVELNNTFYRLPTDEAVDGWRDRSPPGFVFACKGSRFLTHIKRLKDAETGIERYFERIERLGRKLGPILWQLPPRMKKVDLPRLENFLRALPKRHRHAVEFRDAAWYRKDVCDLLDRYGVAVCEHDLLEQQPPRHTGNFRYLRFHGTTGKYSGRYGREALKPVARDLKRWCQRVGPAYVYFNNDVGGHAITDALDLKALFPSPSGEGQGEGN